MGESELVDELRMGKKLVRQLRVHLSLSSSPEEKEKLVDKILQSYTKAISMVSLTGSSPSLEEASNVNATPSVAGVAALGGRVSDSSPTSSGSHKSEDSDLDYEDHGIHHGDSFARKRTSLPRWSAKLRVSPEFGLQEAFLDDGYSWRKYGQKEILGAKYPRGYYRCTHRIVQGCLATKQIQRSDDDPFIFEVIYRGRHTCNIANSSASQIIDKKYPLPPPPAAAQDHHQINTTTNLLSLLEHPNNNPPPLQVVELSHPGGGGLKLSEQDHLATSQDTTPPSPAFLYSPAGATSYHNGNEKNEHGPCPETSMQWVETSSKKQGIGSRISLPPDTLSPSVLEDCSLRPTATISDDLSNFYRAEAMFSASPRIEFTEDCWESKATQYMFEELTMNQGTSGLVSSSSPWKKLAICVRFINRLRSFRAIDPLNDLPAINKSVKDLDSKTCGPVSNHQGPHPSLKELASQAYSWDASVGDQIPSGGRSMCISSGAEEEPVRRRRLQNFDLETVDDQLSLGSPAGRLPRQYLKKLVDLLLVQYPSRSLALNLRAECLVEVYLPGSNNALLQDLVNLKQLDLSNSSFTRMPDLSRAHQLRSLDLHGCKILVDVSSIQYLTKLKFINLKGCTSLMRLPSLMALKFLGSLDISDCKNLRRIPPSLGCLSSLTTLDIRNCKKIQNLPRGILRLISLQTLSISGCSMLMERMSQVDTSTIVNPCLLHPSCPQPGAEAKPIEFQGNQIAHGSLDTSDEESLSVYQPVSNDFSKISLQQPEEGRMSNKSDSVRTPSQKRRTSDAMAQPSPTTGKFSFFPNSRGDSSGLDLEAPDSGKDNFFGDITTPSFAFKPVVEPAPSGFHSTTSKGNPAAFLQQSLPGIQVSVPSENFISSHVSGPKEVQSQAENTSQFPVVLPRPTPEKGDETGRRVFYSVGTGTKHFPLNEQLDEGTGQIACGDSMLAVGRTPHDDGHNWRKYGQKHVKGSEYPRLYYKCTYPSCPVKKKVERSQKGHITEIIYKGAHNHPKPAPRRRTGNGTSNPPVDAQSDGLEQAGIRKSADIDEAGERMQKGMAAGTHDCTHDSVEVTSSASTIDHEFGNPSSTTQAPHGAHLEPGDAVDAPSTFSKVEDDDSGATRDRRCCEGEVDESESKRRKIETYAPEIGGGSRAVREPRVVVQTTIEAGIVDDGYRWRKYGQRVFKGNPNPRSYYKCTSTGCRVRKHVVRASNDLKSVITTYEGKHNHDIPGVAILGMAVPGPGQATMPVTPVHPYLALQTKHQQRGSVNEMESVLSKGEPKERSAVSEDATKQSSPTQNLELIAAGPPVTSQPSLSSKNSNVTFAPDSLALYREALERYMNMPVEDIHRANAYYDVQRTIESLIRQSSDSSESASLQDLLCCLEELQENVPETMAQLRDAQLRITSFPWKLQCLGLRFGEAEKEYGMLAAKLSVISEEEEELDVEIQRLLAKRRAA